MKQSTRGSSDIAATVWISSPILLDKGWDRAANRIGEILARWS
jgi:hypothetical protein